MVPPPVGDTHNSATHTRDPFDLLATLPEPLSSAAAIGLHAATSSSSDRADLSVEDGHDEPLSQPQKHAGGRPRGSTKAARDSRRVLEAGRREVILEEKAASKREKCKAAADRQWAAKRARAGDSTATPCMSIAASSSGALVPVAPGSDALALVAMDGPAKQTSTLLAPSAHVRDLCVVSEALMKHGLMERGERE